jgi:hypothetical protein
MPDNEEQDVLSQNEINDLLNDIGGLDAEDPGESDESGAAEESGEKISIYDFRRPEIVSEGGLEAIRATAGEVASELTRVFSALADDSVTMSLTSIDALTLDEYVRSVGNPCFALPYYYDARTAVLLELSMPAARHLALAALGLPSTPTPEVSELSAMQRYALASSLNLCVPHALEMKGRTPRAGQPIVDTERIGSAPLGQMCCVAAYEVRRRESAHLATLVIGRFALETLRLHPDEGRQIQGAPDLILREVLEFELPGISGGEVSAAIANGSLQVPGRLTGRVVHIQE